MIAHSGSFALLGRIGGSAIERPVFDLEVTYDRYGRLLYSVAYSVLQDAGDAEDCVHDTLLRLWKSSLSYDAGRGGLKTFLVVAVRNASISLKRTSACHARIEQRLNAAVPVDEFDAPDFVERSHLASALRALPAEQWEALRLAYYEHLTHAEVAERLALPLGTVKSRIALAMRKLQTLMPPREAG